MSSHELVVYVGVCGGVLALLRELQAGVRTWRMHRAFRLASSHLPPMRTTSVPAMPPRIRVVRHELACLSCGKHVTQPPSVPCSAETASAP